MSINDYIELAVMVLLALIALFKHLKAHWAKTALEWTTTAIEIVQDKSIKELIEKMSKDGSKGAGKQLDKAVKKAES